MNWLFNPSVATYGASIDQLYYIILVVTGIVFFLTQGLLVYFLIRYRTKEGRRAEYIHGSTKAEVVWTAIPFVIVVTIALMSKSVWDEIRHPSQIPEGAMEVQIMAKQFEWTVTYPGPDEVLGTDDDFSLLNQLHIPVNRPVVVMLEAEDVIHSFFVPEFRVKQDAVPGMRTPVWFEVMETGEYVIGCAELCGTGHTRMSGTVTVHSESDFHSWIAQRTAQAEDS
ncbi:MAG: cytochrome c oxidase subunit II [Gemmatimonadota bacterium]